MRRRAGKSVKNESSCDPARRVFALHRTKKVTEEVTTPAKSTVADDRLVPNRLPSRSLEYRANIFAMNFIFSTKSTFVGGQIGWLYFGPVGNGKRVAMKIEDHPIEMRISRHHGPQRRQAIELRSNDAVAIQQEVITSLAIRSIPPPQRTAVERDCAVPGGTGAHFRLSSSFAAATRWSGSNPKCLCSSLSGAEAPNVFMPMMRPDLPT